ncbi:hypothetical protein [Kitasatospora sp. NBC_01266]|uniref:hypothetical protein n=1 Tax=Kitasatospora sp. NBC_01266 TaxID=2903572 RepID=UPI002E347EF4|nr:hypothetical protein [Kitasatospora sp. NBC_01266]
MCHEVGADGGQQCVGGEVRAVDAGHPVQRQAEVVVQPAVVIGLVRAAEPGVLRGRHQTTVLDLEAQRGVEEVPHLLRAAGLVPSRLRP